MFVFETGELIPSYIVNFPTKRHWRGNSRLEDIQVGLEALVVEIEQRKIRSIALPPLGCGLGGLDWRQVKRLIHDAFSALPDVETAVFEPGGYSPPVLDPKEKPPAMTPGRATYRWSPRKRQFARNQIASAIGILRDGDWPQGI